MILTLVDLSPARIAAGLALTALVISVFLARFRGSVSEPNFLPTWIPFFGHAFRFARDKRSFFLWAQYVTRSLLADSLQFSGSISCGGTAG